MTILVRSLAGKSLLEIILIIMSGLFILPQGFNAHAQSPSSSPSTTVRLIRGSVVYDIVKVLKPEESIVACHPDYVAIVTAGGEKMCGTPNEAAAQVLGISTSPGASPSPSNTPKGDVLVVSKNDSSGEVPKVVEVVQVDNVKELPKTGVGLGALSLFLVSAGWGLRKFTKGENKSKPNSLWTKKQLNS